MKKVIYIISQSFHIKQVSFMYNKYEQCAESIIDKHFDKVTSKCRLLSFLKASACQTKLWSKRVIAYETKKLTAEAKSALGNFTKHAYMQSTS